MQQPDHLPFLPVFIVGVPRSGTTWLQHCLSQHPDVATAPRETHLFTRYLGPMLARFTSEASETPTDGLRHVLSRDDLLDHAARPLLLQVLHRIRDQRPGASVVVEKTPRHLTYVPIIDQLLRKQARYLHMVRDPRAVAASYKAAAKEDWGAWADRPMDEIAKVWSGAMDRHATYHARFRHRFVSIRYERFSAEFDDVMEGVLKALGLPTAEIARQRPAEMDGSGDLARTGDGAENGADDRVFGETRPRFFRQGRTDGWRTDLSDEEIATVERHAGAQMTSLGYDLVTDSIPLGTT